LGVQNQKKAISRKNRSQGKYCNCKVQIFDFYIVLAGGLRRKSWLLACFGDKQESCAGVFVVFVLLTFFLDKK